MDEDEVNNDETEFWDAPELPDHFEDPEHEAPEVAELPEVDHAAPDTEATELPDLTHVAGETETDFEDVVTETAEATELAEVNLSEVSRDDFAHEPAVFETVPAEDLPGMSFEADEIPEYLDDVATDVPDLPEVENVVIEPFTYQRRYPASGFLTANTYRGR